MSEEFEALWRTIDVSLRHINATEREMWRLRLIRRLRHFGVVGSHPASTPEQYVHPKQTGGSMPKLDSPLCECNCSRSDHDEDGSCKNCICPQYTNEDSNG